MGYVQANIVGAKPKESAIDKINKGLDLAQNIMQTYQTGKQVFGGKGSLEEQLKQAQLKKTMAETDQIGKTKPIEERRLDLDQAKFDFEKGKPSSQFDRLPTENQITIKALAGTNANKEGIVSQIEAVMNKWDDLSENEQLQQGKQLIKVLNSTEGKDAVGAEEAKRLAGKLDFAMGNLFNSNPFQVGRDLPGFKKDADITANIIRNSMKSNADVIEKNYGRGGLRDLVQSKPQNKSLNIGDISKDDLLKEKQRRELMKARR